MRTRIDFYLLEEHTLESKWLTACKLLEKAYIRGHQVFVYCNNQQDAELLDELLWTFKNDSFIPHHLRGEGPTPPPPIQIGHTEEPKGFRDILLNLTHEAPAFYKKFTRVIEIVLNEEIQKEQSRLCYKKYKSEGCALHIHQLKKAHNS